MITSEIFLFNILSIYDVSDDPVSNSLHIHIYICSRVQKFPTCNTKAAPNGKCCEGYIVPSMVRLMYQLKSVLK